LIVIGIALVGIAAQDDSGGGDTDAGSALVGIVIILIA